jgi:hypothetical protein
VLTLRIGKSLNGEKLWRKWSGEKFWKKRIEQSPWKKPNRRKRKMTGRSLLVAWLVGISLRFEGTHSRVSVAVPNSFCDFGVLRLAHKAWFEWLLVA